MAKVWALRIVIVGGLFLLWQFGSGTLFDEFFLSRPTAIVGQFWDLAASGRLFYHAGITVTEALTGFLCGGFVGMTAGVVLGRN